MTSAIRDGRVLPRRPACALAAFLLLFTALAVAAPSAQAQAPSSLVSNTAETSNGFSNGRQAQSFTTGSNPAGYSLSEVRLSLTELIIQYTGYTTAVKIRENNDSDQPGDVVATLTNPASLTAGALNTFTAPADTTLSADTVYWVYVNDGIPRIKTSFVTTRSDSQTGLTGWSIADTRLSWIHASGSWGSFTPSLLLEIKGHANSAPVFAAASLTRSVAENTAANTNVGAAVPAATDANSDSLTYSMEGADSASFSFDPATRRIKTRSGVSYDFETKTSYSVTIKASDGTASDTVTVTITLTDVAEQPATPAAPSVSATSGSTTSLNVAWAAPARNGGPALTGYNVQYRAGSNGAFRAWSHSGTSTSATITGLTTNTSYQVQIRALNGETPSGWSPSGTGRTNTPATNTPANNTPANNTPANNTPANNTPANNTPVNNTPVNNTPANNTPANNTPVNNTPDTGAPDTSGPVNNAPVFYPDIDVGPVQSSVDFEWTVDHDIESLDGDHGELTGSWSDGLTLWIVDNDFSGGGVYAYGLDTGERVEHSEFMLDDANRFPRGLWSQTGTVWVSDSGEDRVFVYDFDSGDRLVGREVVLGGANSDARGVWSDGEVLWVLDQQQALFAYDLGSGRLLGHYLLDSNNSDPRGLWSDGVAVWVSDHTAKRIFAYRLPDPPAQTVAVQNTRAGSETRNTRAGSEAPQFLERVPSEEFGELSGAGNHSPRGIWSDGDFMYVVDQWSSRVYTYNMPDAIDARLAALSLSGVDFGEFDPDRVDYTAVVDGVVDTVVTAQTTQHQAHVEIKPDGHQVALDDLTEITVTVTSADNTRTRTYRVALTRKTAAETTTIDVAVWRNAHKPTNLYISTRAPGLDRTIHNNDGPLTMTLYTNPRTGTQNWYRSTLTPIKTILADGSTATIDVAVWRNANKPTNLYISTRTPGQDWTTHDNNGPLTMTLHTNPRTGTHNWYHSTPTPIKTTQQ